MYLQIDHKLVLIAKLINWRLVLKVEYLILNIKFNKLFHLIITWGAFRKYDFDTIYEYIFKIF